MLARAFTRASGISTPIVDWLSKLCYRVTAVAVNVPYRGLTSPIWDDRHVMPPVDLYGKWEWSEYADMWLPLEGHWNFVPESRSWECVAVGLEEPSPQATEDPTIEVDDPCDDELVEIIRIPI